MLHKMIKVSLTMLQKIFVVLHSLECGIFHAIFIHVLKALPNIDN